MALAYRSPTVMACHTDRNAQIRPLCGSVETLLGIIVIDWRSEMSNRAVWKLLHLLYLYGSPAVALDKLNKAGAGFNPRTFDLLESSGGIQTDRHGEIVLAPAVRQVLKDCVVANQATHGMNLRVDYPQVFVVMPFREEWSDTVYENLIKPAAKAAKLDCVRGDETVRIGALSDTIWKGILESGLIIAECSVPNVNVFYELGLTHALGKDALVLKQRGSSLPADIGGKLYVEYELDKLSASVGRLEDSLKNWARDRSARGVGELAKSAGLRDA